MMGKRKDRVTSQPEDECDIQNRKEVKAMNLGATHISIEMGYIIRAIL